MKRLRGAVGALLENDRRLLAFCYAVFFAASVLACLYGFAEDRVQRALGNVQVSVLHPEDFAFTDLVQEADGTYVSQSPDPRMTLADVPAYVRSVTVTAEFLNMDPGEFCLFYQPRPGMEDFDVRYRIWAHRNDDGTYTFTLPRGKVYALRLDPGIYTGLQFTMGDIVLNAPRSLASWLTPTRPWLLAFAAVPALAAAAVRILAGAAAWLAGARKRNA